MRRSLPTLLMTLGVLLVGCGFLYDVLYAGIPYQDPTPEMTARYNHHARVASLIYRTGGGVFLCGLLAGLVRWVARRRLPRAVAP